MNRKFWTLAIVGAVSLALGGTAAAQSVTPVSQLPQASVPLGSEPVPVVQSGATKQVSAAAFGIPITGTMAPTPVARGQMWWDTSTSPRTLRTYDGTQWVPVGTLDLATHTFVGISVINAGSVLAGQFLGNNSGISAAPIYQRPVCGNLSNAAPSCSTDATNASNLVTGTVPVARLPLGTGLQANGASAVVTGGKGSHVDLTTSTRALLHTECGTYFKGSASLATKLTLPASPPDNCSFTFEPVFASYQSMLVLTNGKQLGNPGFGNHSADVLALPASGGNGGSKLGFITITYDHQLWHRDQASTLFMEGVSPLDGLLAQHGQVQFSHDAGNSRFQLCPMRGPGGLIVDGQMHKIDGCITLPDSATTNSVPNYIYADNTGSSSVSGSANVGGFVRLTVSSMTLSGVVTGSFVWLNCHSINGTLEANGVLGIGTVVDATHIDTAIPFVNTFSTSPNGSCRVEFLFPSTTAPHDSAAMPGIQTMSGGGSGDTRTLVGTAVINGAHAPTAITGYFNAGRVDEDATGDVSLFANNGVPVETFRGKFDGSVYAPNSASSGSAQTGFWCYDANKQFIRTSVPCLSFRQVNAAGSRAQQLGTSTAYYPCQGSVNTGADPEVNVGYPLALAGTWKNFYFRADAAPGGGLTFVATLRLNGADTAITCTITDPATSCTDLSHTATNTAGQICAVKVVSAAAAASARMSFGTEFDNP